ncbi:M23 family metallopeptidase [Sphingomonas sp. SUN039]|uniref:M23 family metallopeptidase n=1 Tax=Sphingomonas sp. SUN039 TaxID=2937787 RepID=UPI002164A44E|nr:M23 family metallopeptidase [Sphingomonas sp. SUN039]UVO53438.1 M23 family metallopeptidase [Sphingomonas sp. SUN039]
MSGGRTQLAVLAATMALGGCIPPGTVAPAAPPPPPVAQTRPDSPRLDLDLSQLKDERPIWEMRPVTARAVTENGKRVHVVAAGETGIAIARAYGLPWPRIVEANALAEPFVLRVGQRLLLPGDAAATAAMSPEARAAAFQIGIDDLVTGSEPARVATAPAVRPAPVQTASSTQFLWPLTGTIISRFGPQGSGRVNQGIDIGAAPGAGVRAASAGTVAYVGTGVPGYGGLILLRHDGGWISAYGRIAGAGVAKGDTVRAGQMLGKSGGEPLHFELRRARVPVDPVKYLPGR